MNTMVLLALLIVFLPTVVFAQEKVEAPVWNVGDKWNFTGDGSIEVVKADPNGFILKFSARNCMVETQGCDAIFFEKSTRNRINAVEGDKRKKYLMGLSKVLDFPLSSGKQWKSAYSESVVSSWSGHKTIYDYSEVFKVLGWDDVAVRAGKFKAFKLEYKRVLTSSSGFGADIGKEFKNQYWYSPDVKYFVKCQYDKEWMKGSKDIFDWELTSLQLKK
jgi:hypothetical protein